jgi:hypothetical protein
MPATLVWTEGERRLVQEVSIREALATNGQGIRAAVVEDNVSGTVLPNDALPVGSELLVSETTSDQTLAALRGSGLPARRTSWLMVADDESPTAAIATAASRPGLVLVTFRVLRELAGEIGGFDEAWEWVAALASRVDQPIAVMARWRGLTGDVVTFVKPGEWTPDQLSVWVASHFDDLEETFGPPHGQQWSWSSSNDASVASAPTVDGTESMLGLADVERELDDVRMRLTSELRAKRPDLFDPSGRPKKGALEKAVQEHVGKKKLSRADILELLRKKSS